MSRVYVYGLLNENGRGFRLGNHSIRILDFGGIYAAVERRSTPPELSEARLKAQHAIVEQLSQRFGAILPARFGALLEPSELQRIIDLRRTVLSEALSLVNGQEQMTLRIPAPRPSKRRHRQTKPPSGTAYLRERRGPSLSALSLVGRRVRRTVDSLITAERADAGRDGIRTVVHHLIPRGRSRQYRALVASAVSHQSWTDGITVSGPFAPFAFTPDIWS